MEALLKQAGVQAGSVSRTRAIYAGRTVDLGRLQVNCPAHGPYLSTGVGDSGMKWPAWSPCPDCLAALRALEVQIKRDAQDRLQQFEREERIARACVPQRFFGKTLADFKVANNGQKKVLATAQDYVDRFSEYRERGASLVFAGQPGTGKSLLAAAVLQTVCGRGYGARYTTCQGLIQAVRSTWGKEGRGRESDVLQDFAGTSLLVIDEIGVQSGTESEKAILFDVLDRRYAEMRPTIFATNLGTDGFREIVGDRVWDRLTEIARWIPFTWESYRSQARQELEQ